MFSVQHPKILQINQLLIYNLDDKLNSNVYHMRQPADDTQKDQNYIYWTQIPDPIILGRDDIERVSLAVGAGQVWFADDLQRRPVVPIDSNLLNTLVITSDLVDRSYSSIGSILCSVFEPLWIEAAEAAPIPAYEYMNYRRDANDVFFHQDVTRQTSRFNFEFTEVYRGQTQVTNAISPEIYFKNNPNSFTLNVVWTYQLK